MAKNQEILLESGTNELEIIVFKIAEGTFGINVIKVREIINRLPIIQIPNSHPFVEGIIRLRDEVLPVINLAKALNLPNSETPEKDKYIVAELNQLKVVFHVHFVSRIYRISWQQIEKPTELTEGLSNTTIGIVKMDEQMILLLDYEKIVVDIAPECGIYLDPIKFTENKRRSNKTLISIEDSPILRQHIKDGLNKAGYNNVLFFEDGLAAWEHLEQLRNTHKEKVTDEIHAVITDIEMPRMDGHHLTKKIKEDEFLKPIPVIIFSSLVTDDLYHKGVAVGCDAQVSKPEIVKLIDIIDEFVL